MTLLFVDYGHADMVLLVPTPKDCSVYTPSIVSCGQSNEGRFLIPQYKETCKGKIRTATTMQVRFLTGRNPFYSLRGEKTARATSFDMEAQCDSRKSENVQ